MCHAMTSRGLAVQIWPDLVRKAFGVIFVP